MPSRVPPMLQDFRTAPSPVLAIRIPVPLRIIGLAMLSAIGLLLVALLTWSVDDPSFSYATGKPPANWLGFPGAAVSDICFQLFGIAIYAMLVPPALWGWNLMRRRLPRRFGLRIFAWLLGGALSTGVFAFIAVPASWPLPTGLGGLVGQGFAMLSGLVFGRTPDGVVALLIALVLLAPAFGLVWLAMGLGSLAPVAAATGAGAGRRGGRSVRTEPPLAADPRELEDADVGGGLMDVVIGGLVHLGYSARSAFRRARANLREKRAAEDQPWREVAVEPGFGSTGAPDEARVEPPLASPRRPIHIATEPSAYSEPIDYPDEPEDAPVPPQSSRGHIPGITGPRMRPAAARVEADQRGPGPRVAAPAPRPAPGQRALREAQPSLLDEGGAFELPPLSLLAEPKQKGINPEHTPERLEATARKLESVLEDFGVKGDIINVRPGPVVTLYELEPAPGIKSSRVISLADDIARSMSAISARVAVVPGRNAIGIELPNQQRETVFLREMLASADFEKNKGKLPICLGKTIGGEPVIADLARMPHLLIAGTTGSGKSVGINTFILSLLYRMTPEQCRLIMIDPKMLELSIYDGIPHLLTPVVTDPSKAVTALKWAVREMEDRYRKMSKIGVRNIDGFNQRVLEAKAKGEIITRTVQTGFDRETGEAVFETEEFDLEPLPFIVVIVDEMADLMMVAGKDIEGAIQRLAQMARAAGIHMITATQRPSVDVITGTIKANFPTRISFMVTSKIDSRTILGEQGAEQLLGNGDMLYMAGGGRIRRLHGPFVADAEVEAIVAHLKMQGTPEYLDSVTADEAELEEAGGFGGEGEDFSGSGDDLYDRAVQIVLTDKKASTSYIQRRLAIGYNKAATLIERMEKEGVISPANHAGKREILVGGGAEEY